MHRKKDQRRTTFSFPEEGAFKYESGIARLPSTIPLEFVWEVRDLAKRFIAHEFNILGSGWQKVGHGMHAPGFEGHAFPAASAKNFASSGWMSEEISARNLAPAQRIRALIEGPYIPIDWQIDFRSGYRWSAQTWHLDLQYGDVNGADVKVPWELGRLQHLATLAWAFHFAREGQVGFAPPADYQREFQNQVLDFFSMNPPRYGVQWACTMDAAIRAANLCVAMDIFLAAGAEFSQGFLKEFNRGLVDHGRFIIGHFEWYPELRSNHYLSNICGLLILASHYPENPEARAWLGLAAQEVNAEIPIQFNPDGSNFEGSTFYHRLAAEMIAYTIAYAGGVAEKTWRLIMHDLPASKPQRQPRLTPRGPELFSRNGGGVIPFSPKALARVAQIPAFTAATRAPDGQTIQIGDNDGGRMLKVGAKTGWNDPAELTDHEHLSQIFRGLTAGEGSAGAKAQLGFEGEFVSIIAKGPVISNPTRPATCAGEAFSAAAIPAAYTRAQREIMLPAGADIREELETFAFPDFGLYIFRSPRFFLSVRAGSVGQSGNGGHAHLDQLALTLHVGLNAWITDPGTYIYTPAPSLRNAYRSVKAHYAPHLGDKEPGPLDHGLFTMRGAAPGECLSFEKAGFLGRHRGFGGKFTYRRLEIRSSSILITDAHEGTTPDTPAEISAEKPWPDPRSLPISPTYGVR